MAEVKSTNERIAETLSGGEGLKRFYRFVSQNPDLDLHTACQIVIQRKDITVCKSIADWNAQGRKVLRGRSGMPYFDDSGAKRYLFAAEETLFTRSM